LAGIDLNLLLALDALLLEENVTRAAARIGLSQPATSHALSRLRELLVDPILVREGGTMRSSALGRRLAPEVRRILAEVEVALFGHHLFDPLSSKRTFRLAANDYCGAVLLPDLVARMRSAAPGTRLDVREQIGPAPIAELARGELDLALGTFLEQAPELTTQVLFEESFVCLVRRGHPAARRQLTLEAYAALDHLLVVSPGYGPGVVDHALSQLGMKRNVAVRVPHFLVAPAIVAKSDLIVTLPARLAVGSAHLDGLLRLVPPLALRAFPVSAAWHPRAESEPALVWLRGVLLAAASTLRA
jgi:DNA-binding transcriptional LysR family regulator